MPEPSSSKTTLSHSASFLEKQKSSSHDEILENINEQEYSVKQKKLWFLLYKLYGSLPRRRQKQLVLLMLLAVLSAAAELVSLGSLVPFLSLLVSQEKSQYYWDTLVRWIPLLKYFHALFFFTVCYLFGLLVSNSLRVLFVWASTTLSFYVVRDLSMEIFRSSLRKPYLKHTQINSSEIVDQIMAKVSSGIGVTMLPFLQSLGFSLIGVGIVLGLFWYRPGLTLGLLLFLFVTYAALYCLLNNKIRQLGEEFNQRLKAKAKLLHEALGGIRDIILDQSYALYEKTFNQLETRARKVEGILFNLSLIPRYGIEFLGISILVIYAYFQIQSGQAQSALVTVGIFAAAAQRLLPLGQQIYYSLSLLLGRQAMLQDLLDTISSAQEKESWPSSKKENHLAARQDTSHQTFKGSEIGVPLVMEWQNVSFRYREHLPWVIKRKN